MIGLIGLGTMGKEIAKRFSENNKIYVYNRTKNVAEEIDKTNSNITKCDSIKEISSMVQTLFVCVSDYKALEEIVSEVAKVKPVVANLINFSTILPEESEELHKKLNMKDIKYYDAPISGGPESVINGSLGCVLSGNESLDAISLSFIKKITKHISFLQGIGQAQYIKIINNLMETINMVSAMESIKFLQNNNFEFKDIKVLLSNMRGYSVYAEVLLDRLESPKNDASVPAYIREKDIDLSRKLTNNFHKMEISDLASTMFKKYRKSLNKYDDQTDIYKIYEKE